MVIILVHASIELCDDCQPMQITYAEYIVLLTRSRTDTSIML